MRFHIHVPVLLLAAVVLGGPGKMRAADYDDRAVLAGRQQIRTELARAIADGRLSRMDQYRILLEAREVLPPEDLPGLEMTLNRLASAQGPSGPAHNRVLIATRTGGEEVVAPGTPTPLPGAGSRGPDGTVVPGSPFVEEQPGDVSEMPLGDECGGSCPRCGRHGLGPLRDEGPDEDRWLDIEFNLGVEAFKGPMDVQDVNGNFGTILGLNGGVPLLPRTGLGFQAGANVVMSDYHGFVYNTQGSRSQDFISYGLFQRIPLRQGSLDWAFTNDWLFDHYYANFAFTQWRVKLAWEANPWNEFGGWATLRDRGDSATLGQETLHFRPLEQGTWYWRHTWCNDVSLMARLGMAESPGAVVTGVDTRVPISPRLALTSSFTYVIPSSAGVNAADALFGRGGAAEFWNLSMGLEFVPGGVRHCRTDRFAPVLPVADNGTMMIRGGP